MTQHTIRPRRAYLWRAALAGCALACAFSLGGCAQQSFTDAANALRDGVVADIEQLVELDTETAQTLFASSYTSDLVAAGVDPAAVYGPMFSDLVYDISSISVQDDVATVIVTVSNKDLTAAFQNYTAIVSNELALASSREALAALDDTALTVHLAQILVDCLSDPQLLRVENTVAVSYQKEGAVWKLLNGEELTDVLLGGLDTEQAGAPSDAQLQGAVELASQNIAELGLTGQPVEG